jgi:hypothetical protein
MAIRIQIHRNLVNTKIIKGDSLLSIIPDSQGSVSDRTGVKHSIINKNIIDNLQNQIQNQGIGNDKRNAHDEGGNGGDKWDKEDKGEIVAHSNARISRSKNRTSGRSSTRRDGSGSGGGSGSSRHRRHHSRRYGNYNNDNSNDSKCDNDDIGNESRRNTIPKIDFLGKDMNSSADYYPSFRLRTGEPSTRSQSHDQHDQDHQQRQQQQQQQHDNELQRGVSSTHSQRNMLNNLHGHQGNIDVDVGVGVGVGVGKLDDHHNAIGNEIRKDPFAIIGKNHLDI